MKLSLGSRVSVTASAVESNTTDYDSRRTRNWFSDRGSTPLRSILKPGVRHPVFSFGVIGKNGGYRTTRAGGRFHDSGYEKDMKKCMKKSLKQCMKHSYGTHSERSHRHIPGSKLRLSSEANDSRIKKIQTAWFSSTSISRIILKK